MLKPLIYLASPYSHPDPAVSNYRFKQVTKFAAKLSAEGFIALSPITYGHVLVTFQDMPTDWEFWQTFCLSYLDKCEEMYVLMLDGWDNSTGVKAEIDYAKEKNIPISYIEP